MATPLIPPLDGIASALERLNETAMNANLISLISAFL
jgi:hypothetical protein